MDAHQGRFFVYQSNGSDDVARPLTTRYLIKNNMENSNDGGSVPSDEVIQKAIDESPSFDEMLAPKDVDGAGTEPEKVVEEATTSDAPEEPETPIEKIKLGEQEFTQEQLLEAIKAQENAEQWRRSNTQKAQQMAAREKELNDRIQQLDQLSKQFQQPSKAGPELTPEEAQVNQILEKLGYPTEKKIQEMFEQRFNPLNQTLDSLQQAQSSKEILAELDEIKKTRNLTEEQTYDLLEFADKNKLHHLKLDDAWILMNKDNIEKSIQEQAQIKKQKEAERKQAAARVIKPSGGQQSTAPNPLKYDREKDKNASWNDLVQRAKAAYRAEE